MLIKIIGIVFVLVWIWLLYEAWNAPVMPDDYDDHRSTNDKDKSFNKFQKKQSHGLLGGNLEDVHMNSKKDECKDNYKQPWKKY